MSKVAVVTDSNSGISQELADKMGISVLPMPFTIDGKEYFEGISLTQEEFYEYLKKDADIATSQPSPESVLNLWKELLKEYDEVLHIPMSSGLSGSCQTAIALADDFDGRVQVVNNHRISITQRRSVEDAVRLADAIALKKAGYDAAGICGVLEKEKMESSIYITVATLKYLKKGGRITPAVAAIGTMLRLKPVLTIQGERLDSFSKARTMRQARQTMIDAIKNDIEKRFGGLGARGVYLDIAHTNNYEEAEDFKAEVEAAFPGYQVGFVDSLSRPYTWSWQDLWVCPIAQGPSPVPLDERRLAVLHVPEETARAELELFGELLYEPAGPVEGQDAGNGVWYFEDLDGVRRVEEDGVVQSLQVRGGCNGNLQGISKLVEGMPVTEVIGRLEGIRCGFKPTSCPDQLAQALKQAM